MDLTTRQWNLYNYLKDNYDRNCYISKKEICNALPQHYQIKEQETRTCRTLEYDIRAINNSNVIQKIIVSNRTGYKIGNEQEVTAYLNKRFRRDLKSLKLNWDLSRKVALDGQMRLAFGKEKNVIETFI